jgi:Flp pilus assembly protein TadG
VSLRRQKGFVLIAMSVVSLLLLAMVGLAFDFGRIYIARNEAQLFTDAAALTAVLELNGTQDGVVAARAAVGKLPNRWNLGTQQFKDVVVEFSADAKRWEAKPADAFALRYARVSAPKNDVNITFLRAVGGPDSFTVPARSVAAVDPVRLTQ